MEFPEDIAMYADDVFLNPDVQKFVKNMINKKSNEGKKEMAINKEDYKMDNSELHNDITEAGMASSIAKVIRKVRRAPSKIDDKIRTALGERFTKLIKKYHKDLEDLEVWVNKQITRTRLPNGEDEFTWTPGSKEEYKKKTAELESKIRDAVRARNKIWNAPVPVTSIIGGMAAGAGIYDTAHKINKKINTKTQNTVQETDISPSFIKKISNVASTALKKLDIISKINRKYEEQIVKLSKEAENEYEELGGFTFKTARHDTILKEIERLRDKQSELRELRKRIRLQLQPKAAAIGAAVGITGAHVAHKINKKSNGGKKEMASIEESYLNYLSESNIATSIAGKIGKDKLAKALQKLKNLSGWESYYEKDVAGLSHKIFDEPMSFKSTYYEDKLEDAKKKLADIKRIKKKLQNILPKLSKAGEAVKESTIEESYLNYLSESNIATSIAGKIGKDKLAKALQKLKNLSGWESYYEKDVAGLSHKIFDEPMSFKSTYYEDKLEDAKKKLADIKRIKKKLQNILPKLSKAGEAVKESTIEESYLNYLSEKKAENDKWIAGAVKKKGSLHKALDVPEDKKIPASKLEIKVDDSPKMKKRKVLAQTLKKISKKKKLGESLTENEQTLVEAVKSMVINEYIMQLLEFEPQQKHPSLLTKKERAIPTIIGGAMGSAVAGTAIMTAPSGQKTEHALAALLGIAAATLLMKLINFYTDKCRKASANIKDPKQRKIAYYTCQINTCNKIIETLNKESNTGVKSEYKKNLIKRQIAQWKNRLAEKRQLLNQTLRSK